MKLPALLILFLQISLISLIIFFLTPVKNTYAIDFVSDKSWETFTTNPLIDKNSVSIGNSEEVNFPGPQSYPNILDNAKWIWAPGVTGSTLSADLTQFYFVKKFNLSRNTTYSGNMTIVVDDLSELFVNGVFVGKHGSIDDVSLSGNIPKTFNFGSLIHSGDNTITLRVQNGPSTFSGANCTTCTWKQNPAGIIFSGELNPVYQQLLIPKILQTDPRWSNDIYDHAKKWNPNNFTIGSWGCALTSAVMKLNYYGINKMPNGSDLNPKNLNTWLTNRKDGYTKDGWINWLALSSLSKLSKISGNNPKFSYDALVYEKSKGFNQDLLTSDLNSGNPAILEVPGHFVVATGQNQNSFNINDPFFADRTTLLSYNNTAQNIGRFIPSNTDLSYVMITADPNINITITDKDGKIFGAEFLQNPISNYNNNSSTGKSLKVVYLKNPNTQKYLIKLTSSKKTHYILDIYTYDISGNNKMFHVDGNLKSNKNNSFILIFDKNKVKNNKFQYKIDVNRLEREIQDWIVNIFD